jgi:putative phosphoesterase
MRIAILADTHLPRGRRSIPAEALELMRAADLVLHAGDLSSVSVLEDLRALGPPVAAVHGNIDSAEVRRLLPERQVVDAAGVRIGLVHDAGPARGRLQRMRMAFPECAAVVFGHSHIPLHDEIDGFQIFNPGSPTDRRRQPRHSMGLAVVEEPSPGDRAIRRVTFEHVWLD